MHDCIFLQYSLHYKRENAHDDSIWSVAWGHRERTEEEVLIEATEKEANAENGENKENEGGEPTAPVENTGKVSYISRLLLVKLLAYSDK